MIKNRIVNFFKTKKTLYGHRGKILCAGKTEVGGRLKVKNNTYNSRVCELLKLAHRPNRNNNLLKENDIYVGEHKLGLFYENLIKEDIPSIFEKYKDKVAELWLKNNVGFLKVKYTPIIILLPIDLSKIIKRISENKELFRRQRWSNASNTVRPYTNAVKGLARAGFSVAGSS
jgi:hypothetical protein